jgi:hypothetical protein
MACHDGVFLPGCSSSLGLCAQRTNPLPVLAQAFPASAKPPAATRSRIRWHTTTGRVGVVPIVVSPLKAAAIARIIPSHLRGWISRLSSGTITQAIVVALVVRRITRWLLLRLLQSTLRLLGLLHSLIRIAAGFSLAVSRQAVALIVTIAISHLGVAVVARGIVAIVLDLPLLGIRLTVLLPAFKRHAVHLRALIPHFLPIWICIRISTVRSVSVNALRKQQRQGQQKEEGKFHDGMAKA